MGKDGAAPKKEVPAGGGEGQHQQPQHSKKPEGGHGHVKGGKGHTPAPGGCHAWGCKHEGNHFNFCSEHYDHFKFGLIKKTGEPVSDYEKKFEHWLAHKAKRGAQKVA